ncbi:MAG: hypothetical protein AAF725_15050 [Acidobacteriota bacterium]
MASLTLLGPQRLEPILRPELDRLAVDGQVATITAGWQEREGEIDELREHLGRPLVDLRLHSRCEDVFARDPELFRAHRARQDRLQAVQRLYRYRLDFVLEPARELMRRGEDEADIIDQARASAIEAIRNLDREHLQRLAEVHEEFQRAWQPARRQAVAEHREQLSEILAGSRAVAIAGGHVAVLLNRMRLFSVLPLFDNLPIFAWSAGAMALGERVILFHDSPPQGAGNPEVLDAGLGLYRGLVPLPHARKRLQLQDPVRVSLFARRFSPDTCVVLDERCSVSRGDTGFGWQRGSGTLQLTTDGRLEPLESR